MRHGQNADLKEMNQRQTEDDQRKCGKCRWQHREKLKEQGDTRRCKEAHRTKNMRRELTVGGARKQNQRTSNTQVHQGSTNNPTINVYKSSTNSN